MDVTFEIEGHDLPLRILDVRGHELLGRPFAYEVTASLETLDAPPSALLDARATLTLYGFDGAERKIVGLVHDVERTHRRLSVRFGPKIAALDLTKDFRVAVGEAPLDTLESLLSEHGIEVERRIVAAPKARAQCVQRFESDLEYVQRVLSREGIAWFSSPDDPCTKIVLVDDPSGFRELEGGGTLPVREHAGMAVDDAVYGLRERHRRSVQKVTLRDYDFTHPLLDLEAAAGDGPLEWYGPFGDYATKEDGKARAKRRLEQLRRDARVLTGRSSCRRLQVGAVITIDDALLSHENGRWLLTEVEHRVARAPSGEDLHHECRFVAVPAEAGQRPSFRAEPPFGLQSAVVTGAKGQEIHPDDHGRARVHFRWDRRRPQDDTSSAWTRVVQPPMSGAMLLPRVGWEAIVWGGPHGADAPSLLGRLDNGHAPPAHSLPAKKTMSAFGSLTTPGGGSFNGMVIDDTAGSEKLALTASKNLDEKTENDKATTILVDDHHTVAGSRTLIVAKVHEVAIGGSHTYSVGASRTVNTEANFGIEAGSETVMIGGLRTFDVGGDYTTQCATLTRLVGAAKVEAAIEHQNRVVTGAATVLVGGGWAETGKVHQSIKVGGASTLVVGAARRITTASYGLSVRGALTETLATRSLNAGGDREETYAAALNMKFGGSLTMEGGEVLFKATSQLTVKASGITVTLTPSSVTIDGPFKSSAKSVDEGDQHYQ